MEPDKVDTDLTAKAHEIGVILLSARFTSQFTT
jgi:hypothetical protein